MSSLPHLSDEDVAAESSGAVETAGWMQGSGVLGTKILDKLHKAMKEIEPLEKDKQDKHKQWYLSDERIQLAVHTAFVNNGIVFLLNVIDVVEREAGKTDAGAQRWLTRVQVAYTFSDPESGETLHGTFFGSAIDQDGAGLAKAITEARKTLFKSALLIPAKKEEGSASPGSQRGTASHHARGQPRARQSGTGVHQAPTETPKVDPLKSSGVTQAASKCGLSEREMLDVLDRFGWRPGGTVLRTQLKAITDAFKALAAAPLTHPDGLKQSDFRDEEYSLVEQYIRGGLQLADTVGHMEYLAVERRKPDLLERAALWAKRGQQAAWEKEKGLAVEGGTK